MQRLPSFGLYGRPSAVDCLLGIDLFCSDQERAVNQEQKLNSSTTLMRWLLAFVTLLLATLCQAEEIAGRVVHVADGDTVTVLDASKVQHKVRLAGIDAPEKAQPFGQRSRESLEDLVAGRTVIVETHKKDRYGRYVGKVILNSRDVNVEQIRRGMAWFYREYAHEQSAADRQIYEQAEIDARAARVGLWADKAPTAPWDYRRSGRR